jgi:cytochrome c peroxidase
MTKGSIKLFFGLLVGGSVFAAGALAPTRSESASPGSMVELGKALFHDKTLSNPSGMACANCHDSATGFSYPISAINQVWGTVPGIARNRFGNRKPPSAAYATYLAPGLPHYDTEVHAFVGGLFWDGRANDAVIQAQSPFINPNEMNCANPDEVVRKLRASPSARLFEAAFGNDIFRRSTPEIYEGMAKSIAAYEASPEVSPFTSKYDAWLEGKATLTPDELLGLRLCTGTLGGRPNSLPFRKSAHCMDCHALSTDLGKSRDLWTNSCYANLGVPRNPWNPYYTMTESKANPRGNNPDGARYLDHGLGSSFYSGFPFLPSFIASLDPLRINGTFKAPSLRNVDKRPSPSFVKAYMHNGAFKSLKEVVHFYNTRNLTTCPGEVIDFSRPDPYAHLKGTPLWPRPECLDPNTLVNPAGAASGAKLGQGSNKADLDAEQIGNLHLSDIQEDAIVAFLKTLSDGYFKR